MPAVLRRGEARPTQGRARRWPGRCRRGAVARLDSVTFILPQILGSLPEVIRSCCHHHHATTTTQGLRAAVWSGALAFTSQPPEPSGGRPWEAAFGQRHPRAQPRDVRSAGRDTWIGTHATPLPRCRALHDTPVRRPALPSFRFLCLNCGFLTAAGGVCPA